MAYVAVVGAGSEHDAAPLIDDARAVGRALAEAGAVVVCGGLGGVMRAAAEGVAERGGRSIGLLPGRERSAADPSLTLALPTGLGEARNWLIVCASDAVIAIGGGYGTLSEIALALRAGKPVVALRTWRLPDAAGALHEAHSAEDAVSAALRLARERGAQP